MGRIKTLQIKNLGERLLDSYRDKFTVSFDKNKKIIEEFAVIHSKKVRNRVVGYITHVIKSNATPKIYEAPYQAPDRRRERKRERR